MTASVIAMAVTGSILVAAAASLAVDRLRSLKSGLLSAWLVPLTPRHQRATVLSTLEQTDSISQVMVGPLLGAVGRAFGIPAALAASAAVLAPSAAVVAATRPRGTVPPCPSPVEQSCSSSPNPSQGSSTTSAGAGTP